MKIYSEKDSPQGSLEWDYLRAGKVTASEFDNIVTPKFAARDGKMVETYLSQKAAEFWQGGPLPAFSSFAMEQGNILENADAVPWFEFKFDCAVERVGFIEHDSLPCGCSPDGITNGKEGLEVKCLQAPNHVRGLLAGTVPEIYLPQIHFSLYVTGFKSWRYFQYRRNFPALILTVERDEEIQEKIHDALTAFLEKFEAAKLRLIEINDGPPRHTLKPMEPKPSPAEQQLHQMARDAKQPLHSCGITP